MLFASYVGEDKRKKIIDMMVDGIRRVRTSERYKEFLDFCSRFYNYSLGNRLLIWAQMPSATLVAGARRWNKLGRHIKKGEKGILIYAPAFKKVVRDEYADGLDEDELEALDENPEEVPEKVLTFFKAVYVFDVSQTEGKDLPVSICQPLAGMTDLWPTARTFVEAQGIKVNEVSVQGGAMGYTDGRQVFIKVDVSEMQKIKTLFHEFAHVELGHVRENRETAVHELEAESAAYLICRGLGLDSSEYSFSYLATWLEGKDDNDLRAAIGKAIGFAERVVKEFRDYAGIEAPKVDETPDVEEPPRQAEVDMSANSPGARYFTTEPKEVFGDRYQDCITVKPSAARFLSRGDVFIITKEGDISNSKWLLRKWCVPVDISKRIEKHGGSFVRPYTDGAKSTDDLMASIGAFRGSLRYEFSVKGNPPDSDPIAVFSDKDGNLVAFNEYYVGYLEKTISGIEFDLYEFGSASVAVIKVGGKEAGLLMPILADDLEGIKVAHLDAGQEEGQVEAQATQNPVPDHQSRKDGEGKSPLLVVRAGGFLVVRGKTYPYRSDLKGLGGRWDSGRKCWVFPPDYEQEVQDFVAGLAA